VKAFKAWSRVIPAVAGLLAGALVIAAGLAVPGSAQAAGGDVFVFQGRGYGHGAGMSQWGAWQKARNGETWDQICAFYYPNTTVVDHDDIEVKVKISPSVTSWAQDYSEVRLTGVDFAGAAAAMILTAHDAAGDHPQEIPAGFTCIVTRNPDGAIWVTTPAGQEGPFDGVLGAPVDGGGGEPGRIKIALKTSAGLQPAKEYWGSMRVVQSATAGYLNVYNHVLLERYVRSIAEVDPTWARSGSTTYYAPEAVKAQAVAARTWAVYKMTINGWLNDNTKDVAYAGYTWEASNPGVAQAAVDTAGKVLFYDGKAISSNFSAHSGGYTSANPWGYSTPAYWRVGEDPASLTSPPWNPGYAWTCSISATDLSSAVNTYLTGHGGSSLGYIYWVRMASRDVPSDPGSHVRTLELVGTEGSTTMQAETFRSLIPTDPSTGDPIRSTLFTQITCPHNLFVGADRYETAILVSRAGFPDGAPAVVLTTGEKFPDALVGGPLAGVYGGPLLLTLGTVLPTTVAAELQRLDPETVFIVGLPSSFVGKVRAALPDLIDPGDIVLLSGSDRHQTARMVAAQIEAELGAVTGVVIAPGDRFPDGLAAGSLAASKGWPILLTPALGPFPQASKDALAELEVSTGVEVGTYVDPSSPGFTVTKRIVGADRYDTCARIAEYAAGEGLSFAHLAVTTGEKFPDALAAGPYLALDKGILLLTPLAGLSAYSSAAIAGHAAEIDQIDFIGLQGVVVDQVMDLLG